MRYDIHFGHIQHLFETGYVSGKFICFCGGGNEPSGTMYVSAELSAATEVWGLLQTINEQKHFSRMQLSGEVTLPTRFNFLDYTANRTASSSDV
jgi:hypothetical protein